MERLLKKYSISKYLLYVLCKSFDSVSMNDFQRATFFSLPSYIE